MQAGFLKLDMTKIKTVVAFISLQGNFFQNIRLGTENYISFSVQVKILASLH